MDRSIIIELSEIKPENRRTEKEILQEFEKLKPKILKYILDILAKAIVIKKDININIPLIKLVLHSVTHISKIFKNQIAKMDLLDYISENQLSSESIKDKTYNKITSHLEEFIKSLPETDKQLLLQNINKSYLKYQDSITKGDGNSITELNIKLLMSMLISQNLEHYKIVK
jgi:hypothetical protein